MPSDQWLNDDRRWKHATVSHLTGLSSEQKTLLILYSEQTLCSSDAGIMHRRQLHGEVGDIREIPQYFLWLG